MQNFGPQYNNMYRMPYSMPNYYTQPVTPQPQVQYKMTQVTSRNEADATIPDVSGAPTFFFNRGTNEVYLKQMDLQTGMAMFKEYIEKPVEQAPVETKPVVDITTLNEKLDAIKALLEHTDTVSEEPVKKVKAKND